VIIERRLQQWVRHLLAIYAAEPRYLAQIFQTEDATGQPSTVAPTVLVDHSRQWLPGEWVGGTLTYGGVTFPIEANTTQRIVVAGDLTSVEGEDYQLTLPDIARVQQYLQARAVTVEVTYTRLPSRLPCIMLRLESDVQADPYIGESVAYLVDLLTGEEATQLTTDMRATYLLTVVTENPMETIWLYQIVLNGYLQSQQRFALWGLHGTSIRGMDVHPDLAYLPEQVYGRYIQFACTRTMTSVEYRHAERIEEVGTVPVPDYQELDSKGDPPL
jgi:hypothetical protein